MATGPTLKMSADIAQRIREHGVETYPHECCGALLGRDNVDGEVTSPVGVQLPLREVVALFPLTNRREDSPHNRFSLTARMCATRRKRLAKRIWTWSAGIILIPIIRRSASQYDREHAWPWYSYVM